MHSQVLHNETVMPAEMEFLAAGQVGFLNGWGVFSTIRVRDGVMFAFDRHWRRMVRDAKLLHVPMPSSIEWLHSQLRKLVEANQATNATLRLAIVRNQGGLFEGPGVERPFDLIGFTTGLKAWGDSVRLGLMEQGRHAQSPFAGTKVTSWCQNLAMYEAAQQKGFDEVVLLNERGEVSECTSANIFASFGGRVVTPPLTSGCLPGITREILLECLSTGGLAVSEQALRPTDLEAADEVFITSTTRELLAVNSIQGLRINQGFQNRVRLQEAFTAFADNYAMATP